MTNENEETRGQDYRAAEPNQTAESESRPSVSSASWYAIRVRSNCEHNVGRLLRQQGYSEFAPFYCARRRWSDRTKLVEFPLFPGYVFCQFEFEKRIPVLRTPGVVGVVGFGKEFIPIPEQEIETIRRVTCSGAMVRPWPYLRVGQRVWLRGGALDGIEGLLLDLKKERRIVVSIKLLQRSVAVQIDRESVEPVL